MDPSGIPLFARYFHGKANNIDSTLLAGFFSAIEVFVKTSLDEMLTDIGMTTSRYFFDRASNDYIIVLILATPGREVVDPTSLNFIELLMKILKKYFDIMISTSEEHMLNIHAMIEKMGSAVDNFVFETNMESLDPSVQSDMEYQLNSGQELSDELLNEIKGKIQDH